MTMVKGYSQSVALASMRLAVGWEEHQRQFLIS